MTKASTTTAQEKADRRVKSYTDLMWHTATFVIVNGFLWVIDLMQGGADWAFWITLFWGMALAFHIAAYLLDTDGRQNRRYHEYLTEEQDRANQDSIES